VQNCKRNKLTIEYRKLFRSQPLDGSRHSLPQRTTSGSAPGKCVYWPATPLVAADADRGQITSQSPGTRRARRPYENTTTDVTANVCMRLFNCQSVKNVADKRMRSFKQKYSASSNSLCKLFI